MRKKILAGLLAAGMLGTLLAVTGCVKTVAGTHSPAYSWGQDTISGRYQRSLDQVYQASVQVLQNNGVLLQEYIPHEGTNTVRAVYGKVNQENVWIRCTAVDPRVTQVDVEARTKWGGRDINLVHELEKEIALKLQSESF
jgi:hypothetical protein